MFPEWQTVEMDPGRGTRLLHRWIQNSKIEGSSILESGPKMEIALKPQTLEHHISYKNASPSGPMHIPGHYGKREDGQVGQICRLLYKPTTYLSNTHFRYPTSLKVSLTRILIIYFWTYG